MRVWCVSSKPVRRGRGVFKWWCMKCMKCVECVECTPLFCTTLVKRVSDTKYGSTVVLPRMNRLCCMNVN